MFLECRAGGESKYLESSGLSGFSMQCIDFAKASLATNAFTILGESQVTILFTLHLFSALQLDDYVIEV